MDLEKVCAYHLQNILPRRISVIKQSYLIPKTVLDCRYKSTKKMSQNSSLDQHLLDKYESNSTVHPKWYRCNAIYLRVCKMILMKMMAMLPRNNQNYCCRRPFQYKHRRISCFCIVPFSIYDNNELEQSCATWDSDLFNIVMLNLKNIKTNPLASAQHLSEVN